MVRRKISVEEVHKFQDYTCFDPNRQVVSTKDFLQGILDFERVKGEL